MKLTTVPKNKENQNYKYYTLSEVAQHDSATDLWMIIHGKVYDITEFIDSHPGGAEVLFECAGLDATEAFDEVGHSQYSIDMLEPLFKGLVKKDQAGDGTKFTQRVENVSIGESNWKQRKRRKRLKDGQVIWLLAILGLFAGVCYIFLEKKKWE